VEILGEAADTTGWPDWVKAAEPDVILLDWELPGLPAAALVPTLRDRQPGVHVIALSGRPEARQVAQQAGAGALVSKGEPPECPISAIAACGPASGATLTVPAPTEEATNTPAASPTPSPTPEPSPTPVDGAGRFEERFEGSLDGWQQGADVPDDPVRPGQPVAWSIEVSSEQAAEGDGRQGGDALPLGRQRHGQG
jgi:CheY-like chemotaxis protein